MTKKKKIKYALKILITLLVSISLFLSASGAADECLDCHGDRDLVGAAWHISDEGFQQTVHSELGCQICHEGIAKGHPQQESIADAIRCHACHDAIAEAYQLSPHADKATCRDCHDPHLVSDVGSQTAATMNQTCHICHPEDETVSTHDLWLPQATLHISALPCVTCHMSTPGYEIVLSIEKQQGQGGSKSYRQIDYDELARNSATEPDMALIDLDKDQHLSLAELNGFRNGLERSRLRLRATLVPAQVSHRLMTLDDRYDCTFCHASGRKTVQSGYLMLPAESGSPHMIPIARDALLDALYGNRDLYITGITRSASLDILGLIIICGGLIMPVGHGTIRFLTRKNRCHEKDEP